MRSRAWFLVVGALALFAGCDDSSTTIVQGGATLVGNFPGTQIIDYLVSDDGRAVNHSNAKVNKGLQVFWNSSNGHAIVLYLDGGEHLWAHHWDGTRITPGVELRGPGQRDPSQDDGSGEDGDDDIDDDFESFDNYRVLFLNTSTGGRNGDAIILWSREDDANPADPAENSNFRVYGTYFDVSESANATSAGDATVHYGFESAGTVIDFNNGNDNAESLGFISDSLRFTHAFDERDRNSSEWPNQYDNGSELALTPATRSGDPTTFVWIVWNKDLTDLNGTGIQDRYFALQFNLAQVGNALPVQTALGQGLIDPIAGSTIADDTGVDDAFLVHNGCMIWRAATSTGAVGIFLTCFNATGNLGTIELSQSVIDSVSPGTTSWAGTTPSLPLLTNVYGGDHGLTSLYAFFDVSPNRVATAKFDLDATFGQAAREIEQINPSGVLQRFNGRKSSWAPETRIDRTNSWIFATWLQGTQPLQLAGFTGSRRIHMHGVQTRTSATARTLANSLVAGGPFLAPNQAIDVFNTANNRVFLQSEVANGTQDPRCGIQSNPNRINLLWHEGTFPLIDVKHNGLTIVLSAAPAAPPTGAPSVSSGGLITRTNEGWDFDTTVSNVVVDLGTAAGDPLVYFVNNANNALDPAAPGAFSELRVFGLACIPAATPADAQLVSTDGPGAENALNDWITNPSTNDNGVDDFTEQGGQFLRVKTTPTSTSAGAHGGIRVHLFWVEARAGENSKAALRTRYFQKSVFNPANAAATFMTAHTPSLATAPQGMGGLNNDEEFLPPTVHPSGRRDDDIGPFSSFATATGNTVGIYFTTFGHFWYQEFNGSSWLGAPEIIDNETGANLFMGRDQRAYVFPPMRLGTCDDLSGTLVFYAKPPPGDDPGHRRQFLRVRD